MLTIFIKYTLVLKQIIKRARVVIMHFIGTSQLWGNVNYKKIWPRRGTE